MAENNDDSEINQRASNQQHYAFHHHHQQQLQAPNSQMKFNYNTSQVPVSSCPPSSFYVPYQHSPHQVYSFYHMLSPSGQHSHIESPGSYSVRSVSSSRVTKKEWNYDSSGNSQMMNKGFGSGREKLKKISCTACRRRKIRCDKEQPICGGCFKRGLSSDLCIYDESPWISTVVKEKQLHDKINQLTIEKARLVKELEQETLQRLKLQEENFSLQQNLRISNEVSDNLGSTLADVSSIIKKNEIWDSEIPSVISSKIDDKLRDSMSIISYPPLIKSSESDSTLTDFAQYFPFLDQFNSLQCSKSSTHPVFAGPTAWKTAVSVDKKIKFVYEKLLMIIEEETSEQCSDTPKNYSQNLDISASKNNPLSKQVELLKPFLDHWPSLCIIRLYIENFFHGFGNKVFPGIFSKDEIYTDFKEIFGENLLSSVSLEKNKPISYVIKNVDDCSVFTKISRIALIIRLSQLFGLVNLKCSDSPTLLQRFPFFNDSNEIIKYFDSFKDDDSIYNLLNMSEICLRFSDFLHIPCLPTLHTLVMLYVYSLYSPDHSDSLYRSTNFSSLVLACTMATELGLHKNIDQLYAHESADVKLRLQALWFLLLGYDGRRSLVTGLPLIINKSYTKSCKNTAKEVLSLNPGNISSNKRFDIMVKTLSMSREIMDELLKDNKNYLNLKFQVDRLAQFTKKYYSHNLTEYLKMLQDSHHWITEDILYSYIKQIKDYLHIYALYQTIYQMLYLSYDNNNDPLSIPFKNKYFVLTMKYSALLFLAIRETLKTFNKICSDYGVGYEQIYYLLPVIKECEIRASLFILSIILGDLQTLKNSPHKRKRTSINDLIHGPNILDLTLNELENTNDDHNAEELSRLSKIFTSDNTFIILKFLYLCLTDIWKFDRTSIFKNIGYVQTLKLFHYFIIYIVEKFEDFSYDVSFIDKDFVINGLRQLNPHSMSKNMPSFLRTFSNDIDSAIKIGHKSSITSNITSSNAIVSSNPSYVPLLNNFTQFSDISLPNIPGVLKSASYSPSFNLLEAQHTLSSSHSHIDNKTDVDHEKSKNLLFSELDSIITMNNEEFFEQFRNYNFSKEMIKRKTSDK